MVRLGSAFSIFSSATVGSSLSVMDFVEIGSALSVRSMCRIGSSLSILGMMRLGSSLSLVDVVTVGSSLSLRSLARFGSSFSIFGLTRIGSSVSVLDGTNVGSSLSLRNFARVGSALSIWGLCRLGSQLSVVDVARLGSSLSLRSLARIGSGFSLFSMSRLGSSLSVLDFAHLGSTLSVRSNIKVSTISDGPGTTYIKFNDAGASQIDMYAASNRGMSITSTGGTLHGAWASEATVVTSDRRLKRNIEPLFRTLAAQATRSGIAGADAMEDGGTASSPHAGRQESAVARILRELRPVSFHMRQGSESKYLKFGFIAQELEEVFPNLVRNIGNKDQVEDAKAIASQDLIAVLTLALQTLQKEVEQQNKELAKAHARLDELERAVFSSKRSSTEVHV
mmetsp:Transcript_29782/g.85065  ORF Transcript_29782/g.85065 Transcript_29782/m.85065 type:complete len:395 (-) Transcript_29782:53-1237(-)